MNTSTLTSSYIPDWTEVNLDSLTDLTIVYCRLSQEDSRASESDSIQHQKHYLGDFVHEKKFRNPIFFVDDGYTGTNFNRPAIMKALELVEKGKVSTFIVKDNSRLGRSYIEVGRITEMLFPDNNVRYISVSEGMDSNQQSDMDATIMPIRNLFNEFYARDISRKVRVAQQAMAKAGERLSTNPHYGYKMDPNNAKKWVIDPEAAEIVKRIFRESLAGKGDSAIARGLQEDEIETPSYRRVTVGEKSPKLSHLRYGWTSSMINKILSRPEYLGHTVNYRSTTKSYKNKKIIYNDKKDWWIFENTQEPIIDQETFDVVQKMKQHKRRPPRKTWVGKAGHENIFAGLVYCATCGNKLHFCASEKCGRNADHYKCSRYLKPFDACQSANYTRKDMLERLVLEDVNSLLHDFSVNEEQLLAGLERQFQLQATKEIHSKKRIAGQHQQRISDIDRFIQKLYEDNLSEKLSDERFKIMSDNYESEQKELKNRLETLRTDIEQDELNSQNVQRFMDTISRYTKLDTLTVGIVNELVDKIVVHPSQGKGRKGFRKIELHYNFIGKIENE
ncbi:recombinase family protein [Streptococcus suis]|uniref:recombinase family protein n=1 Tax=Streptococcus suis TaxID=1307 RepID=UPI001ABE7C80|nr:recombinase family protein [Streptococcus suis]